MLFFKVSLNQAQAKIQKQMKYKILLISLFISSMASAQMKDMPFVFGPRVGLQANNLAIENNEFNTTTKLLFHYQLGVFARFSAGKFSIQPEVFYQTKGASTTSPEGKHTYRYISTPLIFGVSPLKGLIIEAGPEFSWAINRGWKKNGIQQFGPDAKNDLGFVAGARIDLLDMFSMFSVNLRYTQGLTNVYSPESEAAIAPTYRNRTFSLGISYNFSEYYKWWKKYGLKKKR
ncbi:MAG: hypothetical protein ACI8UX_000542 [Psychromonas sp.]